MKNNKTKLLLLGALLANVVGCASVGSVTNKMVNNEKAGVIYGYAGVDTSTSAKEVCVAISNKDRRCAAPDEYVLVPVYSKFGYADGAVGINALVKKDFIGLDKLRASKSAYDKSAVFVKANVTPGQLGELVEIVSTDNDGKCKWSGLPKVGGVVCPAYDYDYHKDFVGVVFR